MSKGTLVASPLQKVNIKIIAVFKKKEALG
jgi:hypothetical protein